MRTVQNLVLISATVTTGLVAGVLGAFACAVMPGLRSADDRTFVDVMQRINVAILNPVFLTAFMGGLTLTGAAAVLTWRGDERDAWPWIAAALALYVVMVAITASINVPLNEKLNAAGEPNVIADLRAVRRQFEGPWVRWNVVRSVANVAAVCCLAAALIVHGRTQ